MCYNDNTMNNNIRLPKLTCLRCEHEWTPRYEKKPENCPHCHSPYWNKPRRTLKKGNVGLSNKIHTKEAENEDKENNQATDY